MAIRIKHDPIATPIIASFATGVGQAQERKRRDATQLLAQQQQMQWRTAMQFQNQQFEANQRNVDRNLRVERDMWMGERDDAKTAAGFAHDEAMFDRRDRAYRDKDASDALYAGIAEREEFMRKSKLSDYGVKQMEEAGMSLEWIRRGADGRRADENRQHMATWIREFDSRNPQSWLAPPPEPGEVLRGGEVFSPDGRRISFDDVVAGREKAGTALIPNGRGGVQAAKIGGQDDGQGKMFEWAHSQAMKEFASDESLEGPPSEEKIVEKINQLTRIRESWMKQQGGAAPTEQASPAPPAADVEQAEQARQEWRDSQSGAAAAQPQPPAEQQAAPAAQDDGSQFALGIIQDMRKRYGDINDPKDITHPPDRILLEQAIQTLEKNKASGLHKVEPARPTKKKVGQRSQAAIDYDQTTNDMQARVDAKQVAAMDDASRTVAEIDARLNEDVMGGAEDEVTIDQVRKILGLPPMKWEHGGMSQEQAMGIARQDRNSADFTVSGLGQRALHDIEVLREAKKMKAIGLYRQAQERLRGGK